MAVVVESYSCALVLVELCMLVVPEHLVSLVLPTYIDCPLVVLAALPSMEFAKLL
jgi:hypothetical protein